MVPKQPMLPLQREIPLVGAQQNSPGCYSQGSFVLTSAKKRRSSLGHCLTEGCSKFCILYCYRSFSGSLFSAQASWNFHSCSGVSQDFSPLM